MTTSIYLNRSVTPVEEKNRDASLIAAIKSDPFIFSMFFSLLLIGGDNIALRAGGLTLRVVFPLLMASFAFLYMRVGKHIAFNQVLASLFFLLAVAGAASVLGSYDVIKSTGYTIWILFDFFIIISLAYNFAKLYSPDLTLRLWFLIYRIHTILLLCELLRNIARHELGRPHLWFYESSYLAIFMTGYFSSALFMLLRSGKRYRLDFFLSCIGMLATTSATGIFGMLFAILLNFIVARQRVALLLVSTLIAAILFSALYLFFNHTVYYDLVAGFLFNDQFSFSMIMSRSGNRWIRAVVGWEAFLHHPWLGVGIGGDAAYMGARPFPDSVAGYLTPWMELDQGQPFSNIVIEVLGTMGLAGFVPFLSILAYAGWSTRKALRENYAPAAAAFFLAFFSIFLALQMESTFLRYYFWTPLGLAFGILARTRGEATPAPTPNAALLTDSAKT